MRAIILKVFFWFAAVVDRTPCLVAKHGVKGTDRHAEKTKQSDIAEHTTHTLAGVTGQVAGGEEEATHKENGTCNGCINGVLDTTDQQKGRVDRVHLQGVLMVAGKKHTLRQGLWQ